MVMGSRTFTDSDVVVSGQVLFFFLDFDFQQEINPG